MQAHTLMRVWKLIAHKLHALAMRSIVHDMLKLGDVHIPWLSD